MNTWDLIVIGAGAVGSAALRAAAESGARVLGLEQYTPANDRGSSHGNSRIFRHAYFEHPEYVPLLRHATTRLESLERESGASLLNRCGMLVAGPPGSQVVRGSLASAERWGLEVEAMDSATLRSRFPCFDVPHGTIGACESDAGIVRPEATVAAAIGIAQARGAELRLGGRVHRVVESASHVTVESDHGSERASAAIVAPGPWASLLLPEFAPLLTVTRQVQAWFEPAATTDISGMPCWLLDRGPDQDALYGLAPDPRAVAGSPAASRSCYPKIAIHGSNETVDPDRGAPAVRESDIERIRDAARNWAPALTGRLVDAATCLYTMSPDANFLVGARPGCRRTFVAVGLSGHGFKLAPSLGDALVDLALKGRTDLPIGFLAPGRFAAA